MGIRVLTGEEVVALVGTRHAGTGVAFPATGMQPYYEWLMQTLHLLAESSFGALRVAPDDAGATWVRVLPGRCEIDGVPLGYDGGAVDLAAHNNATARVWMADDGGEAEVGFAADWPGGAHLKLAEVVLSEGAVTQIVDRRFEAALRV